MMELKDIQYFVQTISNPNNLETPHYITSILPILEAVPACINAVLLSLSNVLKPLITKQIRDLAERMEGFAK